MAVTPYRGLTYLDYGGLWSFVDAPQYPLQGEVVDKIGIGTGWSFGPVTQTCVDRHVFSSAHNQANWFWCQSVVQTSAGEGDSGGPVFYYNWRGSGANGLSGISISAADGFLIYSPMLNVNRELGNLVWF